MYDISALGELLIDFTPCGLSDTGMKLLEMNPGGAVANVLCAASRLGLSTAFIGKVGDDDHGRYLRGKLMEYGVDIEGMVMSDEAPTTLAFVDIDEVGERSFSFFRNPGADTLLREDEIPSFVPENTRIFHVGSLSLTDEPARAATFAAVERAKAAGAIISYDPNYRELLWRSREEAVQRMRSMLPYVDMMKLSDNETELLTDKESPEEAIRFLLDSGIKCAVVTAGENGAYVGVGNGITHVDSFRCGAVDTTGAGDAFWGGFLTEFITRGCSLESITQEESYACARFGSAVAACCVMKHGAMPAMPDRDMVNLMMKY